MHQRYDTIVIGAGLGGLAIGVLLSQQGERVLVLEKHPRVGGSATNFERGDFTFDSSLHSISEMKAGAPMYEVLRNLGLWEQVRFNPHHWVYRAAFPDGELAVKAQDWEGYRTQLIAMFPAEALALGRFFEEARALHVDTLRAFATGAFSERLARCAPLTVEQYLSSYFKDERLRRVLFAQCMYFMLPPEEMSALVWAVFTFSYVAHGGFSIAGGSQALCDAMAESIESAGSTVIKHREVTHILTEQGKVTGVRTSRGEEFHAPRVISNAAPHAVAKWVGRELLPRDFLERVDGAEVSLSCLQMYLGLDCELTELGVGPEEYEQFYWEEPSYAEEFQLFRDNGVTEERGGMSLTYSSNADPSLAPKGKSVMTVYCPEGGEKWLKLSQKEYRAEKKVVTEMLIRKAERRLPGLSKHIQVCELGTPRTVHRYTNNTMGGIVGFALTPRQSFLGRFPLAYPVEGLYQVGHWTFPAAGYLGALLSAEALFAQLSRA